MNRGSRHTTRRTKRRVLLVCAAVAAVLGTVLALVMNGSAPGPAPGIVTGRGSATPCAVTAIGACPSLREPRGDGRLGHAERVGLRNRRARRRGPGPPRPRPGPAPRPGACGFPDASDTGPGATSLVAHSGNVEVRTNGETIKGWNLHGSLDIYADNVTIIDSSITSENWWGVNLRSGYTGLRILHSMLTAVPGPGPDNGGEDYAASDMGSGTIEVGWDDVSVFADTLSMGNGSIHDNYVHGLAPSVNRSNTYAHLDPVLSDGDDTLGLIVRHNTILNPVPADKGPTSAIGLLPNTGSVSDTTIQDNWIAGGSYAPAAATSGQRGVEHSGHRQMCSPPSIGIRAESTGRTGIGIAGGGSGKPSDRT